MTFRTLCLAAILAVAFPAVGDEPNPRDWLLNLETDEDRWSTIQSQFGGFDQTMLEVGLRYEAAWRALKDENLELAAYHWDEMGGALEKGTIRRPARKRNTDALFLESAWQFALEAFESGDAERAWEGFLIARDACMACHVAEDVEFMNRQPMFDLKRPEKDRKKRH